MQPVQQDTVISAAVLAGISLTSRQNYLFLRLNKIMLKIKLSKKKSNLFLEKKSRTVILWNAHSHFINKNLPRRQWRKWKGALFLGSASAFKMKCMLFWML